MLYACDQPWWRHYFPQVAVAFPGELWTISCGARDEFGLAWILGIDQRGLSRDPAHIHTGKNSGYQALGLAYLFGVARVVLLGYDFQCAPNGRRHHHADHPKSLSKGARNFALWLDAMADLARDLAATRCKVLNATRRTALKCFPRVTLETALHELRSPDRTGNP